MKDRILVYDACWNLNYCCQCAPLGDFFNPSFTSLRKSILSLTLIVQICNWLWKLLWKLKKIIFDPRNVTNFITVGKYIVIYYLRVFWKIYHSYTTVTRNSYCWDAALHYYVNYLFLFFLHISYIIFKLISDHFLHPFSYFCELTCSAWPISFAP